MTSCTMGSVSKCESHFDSYHQSINQSQDFNVPISINKNPESGAWDWQLSQYIINAMNVSNCNCKYIKL